MIIYSKYSRFHFRQLC